MFWMAYKLLKIETKPFDECLSFLKDERSGSHISSRHVLYTAPQVSVDLTEVMSHNLRWNAVQSWNIKGQQRQNCSVPEIVDLEGHCVHPEALDDDFLLFAGVCRHNRGVLHLLTEPQGQAYQKEILAKRNGLTIVSDPETSWSKV